ncbi:hypothetical protein OG985_43775 [Streptomyces sp. NBC_00289]
MLAAVADFGGDGWSDLVVVATGQCDMPGSGLRAFSPECAKADSQG